VYQIDMKCDRQLRPATETLWVVKQFQYACNIFSPKNIGEDFEAQNILTAPRSIRHERNERKNR